MDKVALCLILLTMMIGGAMGLVALSFVLEGDSPVDVTTLVIIFSFYTTMLQGLSGALGYIVGKKGDNDNG